MKQLLPILATLSLVSSLNTDVRLSRGMDTMAGKLYKELVDLPDNLIISPLSIFSAMGLLQRGAPKGSRTQLQLHIATMGSGQGDGLDALSEVLQDYEGFDASSTHFPEVAEGSQNNDTILRVASALFVDKALGSLKKPFKKDVRGKFGAQVKSVDFADATTTANTINDWVAVKTENFISKLVDSKSLDLGASLMVLNAVYFKSSWDKPFDKQQSAEGKFKIPQMDGHVMTNMMQMKETLRTADVPELEATLVVLDYADKAYSMMILLPDEDLSTLEEKVTSTGGPDAILRPKELLGRARHRFTHLTLPSFSASFETSLVQPFTQLGVTEAFDTRRANFSEITDKEGLAVTNIFHKALIEVDEEGSEAAALTGIILDIRTARVPQVITVDRPFLFYIYDKEHDIPLFMGRIVDPSNGAAELIQDTQSNVRPVLQEVVTDDDGFETEIIEFRNAVAADGQKRRCSCNCTGRASLNCPAEALVSCAASCGGDSKEHGVCIEQCVMNCHQK